MKSTSAFKNTIKEYLDQRAETDELFAASYAKPTKNIDDCITYILNYVQKSGCNGFTDDEIFSQAVHYYDEDDIKVGKPINGKVIVNHEVKLTAAEIEAARAAAQKRAEDEAYEKMKKKQVKPKKAAPNVEQTSLF
ncbi:PcfK-like family protein [uncultured Alistipes sp.]|jgi:hypothetical protein|uniref:PcfK-like family protein n=1 Tax=uncultured Alistipes sp. TaxID=538949 RepID=UPI0025E28A70|nr:PcfK-like family protein [uncultured Alistipes sp.]